MWCGVFRSKAEREETAIGRESDREKGEEREQRMKDEIRDKDNRVLFTIHLHSD